MGTIKDYLDDLNPDQKTGLLGGLGTFLVVVLVVLGIVYYEMRDQDIMRECVKAGHSTTECKAMVQ
jgi:hypothetical protein